MVRQGERGRVRGGMSSGPEGGRGKVRGGGTGAEGWEGNVWTNRR